MKLIMFDEVLYKKIRKELLSKKAINIIQKYNKLLGLKIEYVNDFLSLYYSPVYTVLKQFFKKIEHKNILEIGFRTPLFLSYIQDKGANVYGIDIEPYVQNENLKKMSIESLSRDYINQFSGKFHVVIARITLSRLYDEVSELKTGELMFKNKKKILSNIFKLLRPNGILILQDDRGSIFTEKQFADMGFKKIIKEYPLVFQNKRDRYLGWNVIVAYRK